MEKMLSVRGAANFLGVNVATLRKWGQDGVLTPERTKGGHRRYKVSDLEKYLDSNRGECNYGSLYEALRQANRHANALSAEGKLDKIIADAIEEAREEVGKLFLDNYFKDVV